MLCSRMAGCYKMLPTLGRTKLGAGCCLFRCRMFFRSVRIFHRMSDSIAVARAVSLRLSGQAVEGRVRPVRLSRRSAVAAERTSRAGQCSDGFLARSSAHSLARRARHDEPHTKVVIRCCCNSRFLTKERGRDRQRRKRRRMGVRRM